MFDLRINDITAWISDRGYTSVAIQLPEGLKVRAAEISETVYRATGADVTIIGRPCYGACDLFVDYKKIADALVHFGHSPIPSQGDDPDVMYIVATMSPDISQLADRISGLPDRIGLLATVQSVDLIPEARKILEGAGKEVMVGTGDRRIFYPGQVLGCNCSAAESVEDSVDCFLFLGEGDFHPLAAAFGVGKPVIVMNPLTCEIKSVDDVRDRILRRRFAAIQSSSSAQRFLVIVSDKCGQDRSAEADRITALIRGAGKEAVRLYTDEISPDRLLPFRADAYICTACPRVAMDDSVRYDRPMLTVTEAEIVLGIRTWEDYEFDAIRS
jgi:2-(3-amino-3-carboxypropyl)histidine synthase